MIRNFVEKNRTATLVGLGLLLVGIILGTSAFTLSQARQNVVVAYIDSERILKEYVEPAVRAPLKAEMDKLQQQLDAEIAKLESDDKNKKLEEARALKDKYQAQLDKKKQELVRPLLANARRAIAKVAEERGFTVVLDNATGVVLYGGVDITDAVLQELQKDKDKAK